MKRQLLRDAAVAATISVLATLASMGAATLVRHICHAAGVQAPPHPDH